MADYEIKLGLNYQLSPSQSKILDRNDDTIVRALPGSGKTTLLTHKIRLLLLENKSIKLCGISYTNVNVEDLTNECEKVLSEEQLERIEFLTFHGFCQKFILEPFSYLAKSPNGRRPSSTLFNFDFHGKMLLDYLTEGLNSNKPEDGQYDFDIESVKEKKAIQYNFKHNGYSWIAESRQVLPKTLNRYVAFLRKESLMDHNQTLLFSLMILEQNPFVRKAINRALDWILIDEFQDVTELQYQIITALRSDRANSSIGIKWFLVGDPNQSIYGFAGADPRSMFKMRDFLSQWQRNYDRFEISLEKSYRCSQEVFNYAKRVYNWNIDRVISALPKFDISDHSAILAYLNHLKIQNDIIGVDKPGSVLFSTHGRAEERIAEIRKDLKDNENVCCIGLTRFNSFTIIEFLSAQSPQNSLDFSHYSKLFLDENKEFDEPLFRLFNAYLQYKSALKTKEIRLPSLLRRLRLQVKKYLWSKLGKIESNIDIDSVIIDSCDLGKRLMQSSSVVEELLSFVQRLEKCVNKLAFECIKANIHAKGQNKSKLSTSNRASGNLSIKDVIEILLPKKDLGQFEIKHVHKIKGLEFDKVILHGLQKLPHLSLKHLEALFCGIPDKIATEGELIEYIQDLNKLYVMLTRSKGDLFIVNDINNPPTMLMVDS